MAAYGEGRLGTIVSNNGYSYTLQWEDLLWLGRMLMGEPLAGSPRSEWAALLWHYAQRHAWKRIGIGSSATAERQKREAGTETLFAAHVRFHSQPINPRWQRTGVYCNPANPDHRAGRPGFRGIREGQPGHNTEGRGGDRCSERKLERRDRKANLSWSEISLAKRTLLVDWARARIDNPIPGFIDFAAKNHRPSSSDLIANGGEAPLFGGTQMFDRGNVFYKKHRGIRPTTGWPTGYVKIRYEGVESGETTPERSRSTLGEETQVRTAEEERAVREGNLFVREQRITSDRSAPPATQYAYWTVSGSSRDPQAANVLDENQENLVVRTNDDRFNQQIRSLKRVSTLDFAQSVPVIEITTEDENGNVVSLNQLVFGKSPFHELLNESNEGFDIFPERPIASIVGLTFRVESPSVGGPTGITVGNLEIKIHNPDKVRRDHPRGKFIYYMLKQGFTMRIKYGTVGPESSQTTPSEDLRRAFQWKEQDFFVAQHDININLDKTYDLKVSILPATQKLFNQINIGESIPFSEEGGNLALTDTDLDQVLQNITADGATQEEVNEMRSFLQNFQSTFNQGRPSPGYRLTQTENGQGETTFGSVLHGAIAQSRILNEPEGQRAIPVENAIDALRSIQSILLTRRFEGVLNQDAYMTELGGNNIAVINVGPLVYRLVLPELEQTVRFVAQNNLKIGEEFSADQNSQDALNQDPPRRTRVRLVFGKFNRFAGQWGNRPISEFPVNVNAIFRQLRRVRDVGQFSSTINQFIGHLNSLINEPHNFTIERQANQGTANNSEPEPEYPIERPQIKYLFYPDPTSADSWIMLFYDNKVPLVRFRQMLGSLDRERVEGPPTKEEVIDKLNQLGIPFLEMGESGTIIKNMTARTKADDLIMTHNMIQVNQQAITAREADGSLTIPSGLSREFAAGRQGNNQSIIRSTTLVLPVEVNLTSYMMSSAFLFTPIYMFFPTKMFSGLYLPYVVDQEVRDGFAQTRMTLQINVTSANRSAG